MSRWPVSVRSANENDRALLSQNPDALRETKPSLPNRIDRIESQFLHLKNPAPDKFDPVGSGVVDGEFQELFIADYADRSYAGFVYVARIDDLGIVEELHAPEKVDLVLLEAAYEWCAQKGCTGIDIKVKPGDRASKSLCEIAGFKARSITMHKAI